MPCDHRSSMIQWSRYPAVIRHYEVAGSGKASECVFIVWTLYQLDYSNGRVSKQLTGRRCGCTVPASSILCFVGTVHILNYPLVRRCATILWPSSYTYMFMLNNETHINCTGTWLLTMKMVWFPTFPFPWNTSSCVFHPSVAKNLKRLLDLNAALHVHVAWVEFLHGKVQSCEEVGARV